MVQGRAIMGLRIRAQGGDGKRGSGAVVVDGQGGIRGGVGGVEVAEGG